MKIHSVGFLSLAGMLLTSLTVWAMTSPRQAETPDPQTIASVVGQPTTQTPTTPTTAADRSQFTAGSTLMVEGRLGHARLAVDRDNETFLFINVKGQGDELAKTTAPVNLSIVVDQSGSMEGQRMRNALEAARGMVQRLRDGDAVSVVAYNDEAQTIVPLTAIDAISRERVIGNLRSIAAGGRTCISCGIEAGMSMLRQRSGMVNRMLLLSDGEANRGVRDVDGFRRIGERARGMGAAISSIGVDVEYNERLMLTVARHSNGRHYFVENPLGLPRIFDEELESLVRSVAKDTELTLELGPGVEIAEVLDRSFRRSGDRLVVSMGTFALGEEKTLLARLRVPRGGGGERPIADVRLAYDDLTRGRPGTCEGQLLAVMTPDPAEVSAIDPLVLARLSRSETAAAIEDANDLFASGKAEEARTRLQSTLGAIKNKRKKAASAAPASRRAELEKSFDDQAKVLGGADADFGQAQQESPAEPAAGRRGKSAVRNNAASLDELFQ